MTIAKFLQKNHDQPRHECELVIAHVLKYDRLWVLTHLDYKLPSKSITLVMRLLNQLRNGMPLAQIIGLKRFYDVDFIVNKHVLIPRQETEELIELVASDIASYRNVLGIADIGTGSGCIGLILAKKFSQHHYFLVDKSKRSLHIAHQNADMLDLYVEILFGDLLVPLRKSLPNIIVANLPYLNAEIYRTVPLSVRKYEPRQALYGGKDGLDVYRRLFRQIKKYYNPAKYPSIWLEISPEQEHILNKEIKNPHSPFSIPHAQFHFSKDLSRQYRFVHVIFSSSHDNKD